MRSVAPYHGTVGAVGAHGIDVSTTDTGEIAELKIMRDAVVAGKNATRVTTLDGAISASATSITVDSASNIKANGYIVINEEIMKVSSKSGNVVTVIRGQKGTVAEAQVDNADVFLHVSVWYYDGGWIPYEDLPSKHAIIHTLHDMHPDGRGDVLPTIIEEGDSVEDSETGKVNLHWRADMGTKRRVPDGTSFDAPLLDFRIIPVDGDEFVIRIMVDPDDKLTASTPLQEIPGIIELEALLKAWRVAAGGTLSGSITAFTLPSSWGNTNLDWEYETGSTLRLQVNTVMTYGTMGPDNHLSSVDCSVTLPAGHSGYDEVLLQTYFDTQTVEVNPQGRAMERTFLGLHESFVRGRRIYLSDSDYLQEIDGHLHHSFLYGGGTQRRSVALSRNQGISLNVAQFAIQSGDTYKRIPNIKYLKEVHLDETASASQDVQLPYPVDFVGGRDRDRPLVFHNKHATHKLRLRDWDGNLFFTVLPNERCEFLLTQGNNGAGECISVGVPNRHLIYEMITDDLGFLDDWKRLDTVEGTVNGSLYLLPQPASSDFVFLHDDFFEIYTAEFADDLAIFSQASEAAVKKAGAIKLLQDVTGFMQGNVELKIRASNITGQINNPEIRFLRYRGGSVSAYARRQTEDMWSDYTFYDHDMVLRERVQKDDILIPGLWCDDDDNTLSDLGQLHARHLQFELTVEPQISLEHTP